MKHLHIDSLVDAFAQEMKNKLHKAEEKGRFGWDTDSSEVLMRLLVEHIEKGDMVDVANFAAFLWNREMR